MNIEKLIEIGNRAKEVGGGKDYALSNMVFAVLLQHHLDNEWTSGLDVEIETQDLEGCWDGVTPETFYDLVVVKIGSGSLCIPLPLLEPVTVATLVKRGNFVERDNHHRNYEEGSEEEMASLWKKFWGEVSRETAYDAVLMLQGSDNMFMRDDGSIR